MVVLEIKSASTMYMDGSVTCLSYKRADMDMAVVIISMTIMIWQGKVILIRYY